MLTEVGAMLYAIKVNGQIVANNIPSRVLAEATLFNLPPDQRKIAEIVPVTGDGKTVLFG